MNKPYKYIAEHYDDIFNFHIAWFERARVRILGALLPHVATACDLACGTATTALMLARRGIRMYGVDLSPTMRRIAREKAAKSANDKADVRILAGDMRHFRLPEQVDLVLCEFDALNHVDRKEDLALVAKAVSRALRPGGSFYFDVNNLLAFQTIWVASSWTERPGLAMATHGGYDRDLGKGVTVVEWFFEDGKCWKRYTERVEQVAWARNEIEDALREAGFDRVQSWDATPFFRGDPWIQRGCRTFYLARKGR